MMRAAGASFLFTLLLLCFLQEGVGAADTARSHGRAQHTHDETGTRDSMTVRMHVEQDEQNVVRAHSSDLQQHTRSGEMRTTAKAHVATHATRTDERNDWNSPYDRNSGNGVVEDDRTERTHYLSGGETKERTHSVPYPPPPRASDVVDSEERHSHTRDSTTTTKTSHSRTHVNEELYDRHGHTEEERTDTQTGEERTNAYERPAPKASSSQHDTKERTGEEKEEERIGGGEEETTVQTKTEAHPIGLINGLDGKAKLGRSIELDARELDATTTIIASAFIGFLVLVLLLFCVAEISNKRREKKADSTRLLRVFQYLHEFNVDDIDIQLSAAGGFHVGYLNGLAQGINSKKQPDQKTDSSSDEGSGSLSKRV